MDMISNHYPLEGVRDATAKMRSWEELKPAITFEV
jgi:hypothetical protein